MKPAQLLTWRTTNKLSQEEAARHIGKVLRTYRRYEKGESAIPEDVAGMVMATPNIHAPGLELAPPFGPRGSETPWTHPRLFRKRPGKKLAWERIEPGTPLLPEDYPDRQSVVFGALEAAREAEAVPDYLRPLLEDGYEHEPDGDDQ